MKYETKSAMKYLNLAFSKIEELNLSYNHISDVTSLVKALSNDLCVLGGLNLHNNFVDDNGCCVISKSKLVLLNLGNN